MNLSTQEMRFVCILAQYKHFRKAAQACYTSQPNLSTQIKNIEAKLGVSLFERTNKMVRLTRVGERVVAEFQAVLQRIDHISSIAQGDPFSGCLNLGIIPTMGAYLLPHIIPLIKQKFPRLSWRIFEDKTEVLVQKLNTLAVDCAIAAYPITADFAHMILFEDPFFLAVPTGHPLASHRAITVDDLKEEPLLLLEEGHCFRDQALDICYGNNLQTVNTYRAASLETLRAMVGAGSGITLIPKLCIRKSDPLVVYIPFNEPVPTRKVALFWKGGDSNEMMGVLGEAITAGLKVL